MVPLPFAMWVGEHDGVLTVRLAGRFEAPWADDVHRELLRHCPTALWLDLSGVTSIDSAGLATLVAVRHGVVSGGGRFVLHGVGEAVQGTFTAAGLDVLVDDERAVEIAGSHVVSVTHLSVKGGRNARRPAAAPKVA